LFSQSVGAEREIKIFDFNNGFVHRYLKNIRRVSLFEFSHRQQPGDETHQTVSPKTKTTRPTVISIGKPEPAEANA
jgi:hypothetical protein